MDLWLTATVSGCKRVVAYRFTHAPVEPLDCMEALKASELPRGRDFIGQTWIVSGEPHTIAAVETYVLERPVRTGEAIGVIFV